MIWLLRSLLIALSAAFLVITFFLANTSKKYDIIHKSDALSFEAPHQQSDSPRRNLSEAESEAEWQRESTPGRGQSVARAHGSQAKVVAPGVAPLLAVVLAYLAFDLVLVVQRLPLALTTLDDLTGVHHAQPLKDGRAMRHF